MNTTHLTTEKVDTLKHLSDHGLAVTFEDKKRQALLEQLKAIEFGKIILEAKASRLTIYRAGGATLTKLELASHAKVNLCKFSTFSRNPLRERSAFFGGAKLYAAFNSIAWSVLKRSCMGEPLDIELPKVGLWGSVLDSWRTMLSAEGWILLGESGLRSVEQARLRSEAYSASKAADLLLSNERHALERLCDNALQERLLSEAERDLKTAIQSAKARKANFLEDCEKAMSLEPSKLRSLTGFYELHEKHYQDGVRLETPRWYVGGTRERWSHDEIAPNYSARIEDGRIKLSSGVVCDVEPLAVLDWLRGKSNAPSTNYGILRRLETRIGSEPRVLVSCGCHRINPSTLGEEWAEASKPRHQITKVEAVPELGWLENESRIRGMAIARLRENYTRRRSDHALEIKRANRLFKQRKELSSPDAIEAEKAKVRGRVSDAEVSFQKAFAYSTSFPRECPKEVATKNALLIAKSFIATL